MASMKTEGIIRRRLRLIAGVFLIVILAHASAALSAAGFMEQFIESYRANNFNYLATLVKSNGTAIPAEVKAIVKEAMAEGKPFEERMALLDIASAMASMHKHWNGDEELIKEVEAVQRAKIKKEEARRKELTKWDETAARLGAGWSTENLPPGRLPLDRFGSIDWVYLKAVNAHAPLKSAGKDKAVETRDSTVLFEPAMAGISPVPFSHSTHSSRLDCSSCHPALFSEEPGANKVNMKAMAEGKFCGYCHGKVAFRFAECNRCHAGPKDRIDEKALKRN
ncbi:MAG: cytochrome c3 family protein [Deltaproteobacteria bacterium]|nr:cytochrome c3 family protein [Deltaproteobacteria bacterium]